MKVIPVPDRGFNQSFVLCLDASISLKTAERNAAVRAGSHAADIIARLHDYVFYRSLDLKQDYLTYFVPEYQEFRRYLDRQLLWPAEVVDAVCAEFDGSQALIYLDGSHAFVAEDFGQRFLETVFQTPRVRREAK